VERTTAATTRQWTEATDGGVARAVGREDNPGMKVSLALATAVAWLGATACGQPAEKTAADRALDAAKQSIARGDNDAAIVRLDEAVRLAPKEARPLGLRGVVQLRMGDYVKGAADLKAAVALNFGDAGQRYRPTSEKTLPSEALEHGRKQVEGMLRDRPAMAERGKDAEFLSTWAARKFAGEDFGEPIDWDPSPPLHSDAEHLAPGGGDHAAILVAAEYDDGPKEGRPRSFEELWAGAVYELHNVVFAREFVRLNDDADRGRVSKREFIEGILRCELRAAQQTRAFYLQVYLPWAEKEKRPTNPSLWFCDWWATPENVLQGFTDRSAYPWRPYARTHDWAAVHHHWRQEEFRKALRILVRMCGEEGYEDDEPDVHFWMGQCYARLDKNEDALAQFTKSIELDSDNAAAYRARARLYREMKQNDKAEADEAAAKRLEKAE
jgi:tetratricopeptide (TPR) repeat protein